MDNAIQRMLSRGREVLVEEGQALVQLAERLDHSFCKAVEIILQRPASGRVIISGMGKAGFVGMKLSATLASTGVPSFFLHPADAIHGDLGRYTSEDIAVILSNSGQTEEILRILGPIKQVGCPIIAITGDPRSKLAQHSEVVLNIDKLKEAGPLGLAPTTSTTVMLALGDALAMVVLENQNFTKEMFARYHPGGNLGRSLMLVSEMMRTESDHCRVPETYTVRETLAAMMEVKKRTGSAAITDSNGLLSGIFTNGDLKRCLVSHADLLDRPVSEVMTRSPKTIRPTQLIEEAIRIMKQYAIDELIVIDDERKPVGLLDIQDIVDLKFGPSL